MRNNIHGSKRTFYWTGAVLLSLLVAILFSPCLMNGRVLAPLDIVPQMFLPWRGQQPNPEVHNHFVTDAVLQYIPYRLVMHESLQKDGYVGWNPLILGGTAQHANTMLVNQEVTMLLHKFLGFWTAWNLGRMLQFLVAGFGMLLFLRGLGAPAGIATMGSVAYMLNHQFVAWIYFNQVVAAFCWVPWVLWALHKARDGSFGYVAVSAAFICLALLGATLQQAAFVVAVLTCLWLGWLFDGIGDPRNVLRCTLVIGLAALLGAGLAAFALEPGIAAYLENERAGHGRGCLAYESGWVQPVLQLSASPLTFFPSLLGSVQTLDLWKLFKLDLFFIGFFGTVPMLLAVVALFSRRVPMSAKLMMLAGVIVPLTPLVGFVYHRFNIVWILGGCWAAAAWLTQASDAQVSRFTRIMWRVTVLGAALWLLASAGLWMVHPSAEAWLQGKVLTMASGSVYGLFTEWMRERASRLLEYLCIWNLWQLMALGGLLLSLWGLARIRSVNLTCYAAAAGVALQLSVFWWQWTTWSEPEMPYGASALEKVLRDRVGSSGRLAMKSRPWAEYVAPPNTLMPAGIAVTGGYDAMHPFGMRSPSDREWDFPGTTHFLGRVSEDAPIGWPIIWTDGEWQVWEKPNPAMGTLVVNGGVLPLPVTAVQHPTFNTMEVNVPAGASSAEIFSNWHRGWEWRGDLQDKWNKVAIGDNRTMRVDFGETLSDEKTVYFRFNPSAPAWVKSISITSLLVILAVALVGVLRERLAKAK